MSAGFRKRDRFPEWTRLGKRIGKPTRGAATPATWRPIPGVDGYEASSLGAVRGPDGVECQQYPHPRGYRQIAVVSAGLRMVTVSHRLVARAFLGPVPPGLVVNHRNGVKTDNRVENLEYVTPSENMRHAYRTGLRGLSGVALGREARS